MKLSFVVVFLCGALLAALGGYAYFSIVRPARAIVAQVKPEAGRKAIEFAECLGHGTMPACSDPLVTEGFRTRYPPELLETMVGAIHARYGAFRSARVDDQSFTATESRGPAGKRLEVSLRLIATFDNEPAVPMNLTLTGSGSGDLRVSHLGVAPLSP